MLGHQLRLWRLTLSTDKESPMRLSDSSKPSTPSKCRLVCRDVQTNRRAVAGVRLNKNLPTSACPTQIVTTAQLTS